MPDHHRALLAIEYDPHAHLAPAVLDVLRDCGPLKTKEIAAELRDRGHGHPYANAINKVLTDYLADKVIRVEDGRWAARPDVRL